MNLLLFVLVVLILGGVSLVKSRSKAQVEHSHESSLTSDGKELR